MSNWIKANSTEVILEICDKGVQLALGRTLVGQGVKTAYNVARSLFQCQKVMRTVPKPQVQVTQKPSTFLSDSSGHTIDLNFTKNLRQIEVPTSGTRGGRMPPPVGIPNSYSNLDNGHVIVYGPNRRQVYDVSSKRIKIVEWNKNPTTNQWHPSRGKSTKVFEGAFLKVF